MHKGREIEIKPAIKHLFFIEPSQKNLFVLQCRYCINLYFCNMKDILIEKNNF